MLAELDLPHLRDNSTFIAALITEPPGALAIINRAGTQSYVFHLSPPQRGKRFSRYTETGRVLHALHADGVLGMVMINMPEAYNDTFGHGAAFKDPDIVQLLERLDQLGVPFFATATPLWRPWFDQQDENGTLAERVTPYLPEAVRDLPQAKAQCTDAVLLSIFTNADADDGQTARPSSHDEPAASGLSQPG